MHQKSIALSALSLCCEAVSRSPFCLAGLFLNLPLHPSFFFFFFWLFLEEVDFLPKLNETLAPSSTQNLLADKLEVGYGL